MPTQSAYTLLPTTPTDASSAHRQEFEYDDTAWTGPVTGPKHRPCAVSEATAWRFLVSSCILALALSATNLTYLSFKSTATVAREPHPASLKRPSVYLGLENVVPDPSYCRSRGTFPKTFYTYDTRDSVPREPERVHAPDDKMTLTFGGSVRAVVDTYMPDYGLENCTLSVRRMPGPEVPAERLEIEVYLLPSSLAADRSRAVFLDTLAFTPGVESTSIPFHCPSRAHVFFEWRSEGRVVVPLEGVTSLTASAESLTKTGFRVTQYEALRCISD